MNKSVYLLAATALLVACSAKTPNAVDAPTAAEPGPLAAPQSRAGVRASEGVAALLRQAGRQKRLLQTPNLVGRRAL